MLLPIPTAAAFHPPRNLTDEMIKVLADHGGVAGINFGPEFLTADLRNKNSTLDAIVAQFQHFVRVGGEGCVGIGTDFDGISGHFEVGGPQQMELLFHALQKRGFHERQIEGFARGNVRRVLQEVLK